MKFKGIVLIVLVLVFPFYSPAQGLAGQIGGLQKILDQLYNDMLPLCAQLISVGRGLAGFAALFYALIGLVYLKKLFQLHNIGDKTTSIIVLALFFGTNLLNYTLSEAGMSHVYSFSLISVFLYHSSRFVLQRENKQRKLKLFMIISMINVLVLK